MKNPKNGDVQLVTRFFFFPETLFGVRKWGLQKVYKKFHQDYVNYEEWKINCWSNYCWEDQPEALI